LWQKQTATFVRVHNYHLGSHFVKETWYFTKYKDHLP
jgi:hypothetical protein